MRTLFVAVLFLTSLAHCGVLDSSKRGVGVSYGLMGLGISYFDRYTNSEVFGSYMDFSDDEYDDNYDPNKKESEQHLSLHYRRFFKEQIGGFYYGAFARLSKLEGKLKNEHSRATQTKFGIGGEIGYTSFNLLNYPSLYWGAGLGLGAYLSGKHDLFERDDLLGDMPVVLHLDILRVGYVF